jgi:hypothetical protein
MEPSSKRSDVQSLSAFKAPDDIIDSRAIDLGFSLQLNRYLVLGTQSGLL